MIICDRCLAVTEHDRVPARRVTLAIYGYWQGKDLCDECIAYRKSLIKNDLRAFED